MQSKEGRGWSRSWTELPGHQGTRGVSLILARPSAPTDPVPRAGPPAKCLLHGRAPQGLLGVPLHPCPPRPEPCWGCAHKNQRTRDLSHGAGSRRSTQRNWAQHTVHHVCIQVTPELRCPGLAAWRTQSPGCHRLRGGTECYREDGWFGQVWVLLHSQAPAGGPWTWAGQCLVAHLGCSKASLASTGCKPGPGGGASTTFPEGVVLGSGGRNRLRTESPRDTWVWCLLNGLRAVTQTRSHSRIKLSIKRIKTTWGAEGRTSPWKQKQDILPT